MQLHVTLPRVACLAPKDRPLASTKAGAKAVGRPGVQQVLDVFQGRCSDVQAQIFAGRSEPAGLLFWKGVGRSSRREGALPKLGSRAVAGVYGDRS